MKKEYNFEFDGQKYTAICDIENGCLAYVYIVGQETMDKRLVNILVGFVSFQEDDVLGFVPTRFVEV